MIKSQGTKYQVILDFRHKGKINCTCGFIFGLKEQQYQMGQAKDMCLVFFCEGKDAKNIRGLHGEGGRRLLTGALRTRFVP